MLKYCWAHASERNELFIRALTIAWGGGGGGGGGGGASPPPPPVLGEVAILEKS